MDLARSLRRFLFALCLLIPGIASALVYSQPPKWTYSRSGVDYEFDSAIAACADYGARIAYSSVTLGTVSGTAPNQVVQCSGAPSGGSVTVFASVFQQCVVVAGVGGGYSAATGFCSYTVSSCPSGYSADGSGNCKPACPSGQSIDPATNSCTCNSDYSVGGQMIQGDGYQGCTGGCTVILQSGWYDKAANVTWGYNWKQTGRKCAASDTPTLGSSDPKVLDAKKCGSGLCPGTVNGQSVCVACSNPKETTTTKDSSTEVKTPTSGASSATSSSSSSSSSTKCTGDTCTTTTTTTTVNPDGSKLDKTSTKEQPKQDFCTDNPKSAICAQGTWGGSCGSFSCDGDAVQCAQAQAAWKSACALDIDSTDTKAVAGNAALSAGVRSAEHPGNNPDLKPFSASLNTTNPYGASCPADFSLNAYGHSVVVPLSSACDVFTWMGRLAVALALVVAGRIVFA